MTLLLEARPARSTASRRTNNNRKSHPTSDDTTTQTKKTMARKKAATIPAALIKTVLQRLGENKRVRRTLPGGGRLHIDRQLPFLCVYRQPAGRVDPQTEQLIKGEASFLIASDDRASRKGLAELVQGIAELMAEKFGAFLIVEVWAAPDREVAHAADIDDMRPTELRPTFTIAALGAKSAPKTVERLERGLRSISLLRQPAEVDVDRKARGYPPGMTTLVPAAKAKQLDCHTIGLSVRPIYREPDTGEVFPKVLRDVRRGLGRVLKQTFYTFARTRTTVKPTHYYALGRRSMVKAVWEVDKRLAKISDSFDFLLQVTPVNAEAAWREFRRSKFEKAPRFYYRPLAVEPTTLKRQLYEVSVERIEDPTLADLFRERQDELDRKITMLLDVDTPRFLLGSLQVYGRVPEHLLTLARELLATVPTRSRGNGKAGELDANAFALRANEEIEFYRAQHPGFAAEVTVREDMFSGLLCSGGNLLIGRQTKIPANRVDALLQHEIGTHLLTYYNGLAAPFQQLHAGFAAYDGLQEGLAVLTEYLVGGMSRPRLRLLAGRVVAAAHMVDGASFVDTFRLLDRTYQFSQRVAYTITMRTYRGGGLTKDVVYLDGLVQILDYLSGGGDLEPLFVGKIATDHIPLIRELQHRHVLPTPPLRPRYMDNAAALERLSRLADGVAVQQLLEGQTYPEARIDL